MEKINGICIDGKFYKAVKGECKVCDLYEQCKEDILFNNLCNFFEGYEICKTYIFRYSPELTGRLNNSKTKEK